MDEQDHEIGSLLGGAVSAIQEAQIAAEREYLAFVLEYGLEEVVKTKNGKRQSSLRLRQIEFDMTKMVADPSAPGEVVETSARVKAPLLSMVQLPAVGIEHATIELNLDVYADTEVEEEKTAASDRFKALPISRRRAALKGAVGTRNRSYGRRGKLNVSMTLKSTHDDEVHGRLERLLSTGLSATAEVPDRGKGSKKNPQRK